MKLVMKTMSLAPLLAASLLLASAVCAEEIKEIRLTPKEAGSIKSYDLHEVQANSTVLNNELIKVKFTYRVPETVLLDEGVLQGTIGYSVMNVTTGIPKTGSMVVHVPKEGRSWYMKLATTTTSRRPLFAFARVQIRDNLPYLDFVGRELKSNLKGPAIVWEP